MNLYALVYSMDNIIPMIFSIKTIAEIFPNDDESFMITLKDGRDFWCKQIGCNKKLLSVNFTDVKVTTCDHDIYNKDFINELVSLRNSSL